ncbi:MAG: hypothetical protein GY749_32755 [Desulfobacteraceae bacterium]|nr:hypothetical protein [Desulfobacteraceae bacterium]
MPIKTHIKDTFLLRTLYILTAIICIFDLFYMNIRLEFLAVLPVFAVMLCCYKFGDSGIGMVTGGIIGALTGAAVVMEINLSAMSVIAETIAGAFVGTSAGIFAWVIVWKSGWAKTKTMRWVIAGPPAGGIITGFLAGFFKSSSVGLGGKTVWGVIGGIGGVVVGTFTVAIVFLIASGFTVMVLLLIKKSGFIVFIGKTYSEFINLPVKISAFLLVPPLCLVSAGYLSSRITYLSTLPVWGFYALLGGITLVLSIIFIYIYNLFLLHFKSASENEKERWDYISAYPRVFCEKHFLKPVVIRKALFYYDVRCRARYCRHTFITGLREVTGLIGSDIDKYKKDRNRAYVSLWSEPNKKARNADIDVLEITEAKGISYDHAISAVLMALINDASRPREYVKKIPVVISGNPSISEGSMKILKYEFGGIVNRNNKFE